MKTLQKFLIITTALFVFCINVNIARADSGLIVEFQNDPLFSEINFVPNESVTKYVKVTNNSDENRNIIIEAINSISCNNNSCLSEAINLVIKNEDTELFNDSLETFLDSGEINLGNINNSSQKQYNFIATFQPEKGNEYQSLSTGFDLLVGFQGDLDDDRGDDEIIPPVIIGGGGVSSPPGLVIKDEAGVTLGLSSVEIKWYTNYRATSQVIYREEGESYSLDISAPKYGYPRAQPDPENLEKVLNHSVTLNNLTPGKKYYYRVVSHASPVTIGKEHSFEVPAIDGIDELPSEQLLATLNEMEENGRDKGLSEEEIGNQIDSLINSLKLDEDISTSTSEIVEEAKTTAKRINNVAATIFGLPDGFFGLSYWWLLIILPIILIVWYVFRRSKDY